MAVTYITSVNNTTFNWEVAGLGSPFNTTYYSSAGICLYDFTNGQTTRPNGVLDYTDAPTYGSSYSSGVFKYYHSYPGQTITVYGFARAITGGYWKAGDPVRFTIPPKDTTAPTVQAMTDYQGWTKNSTNRVWCRAVDYGTGIKNIYVLLQTSSGVTIEERTWVNQPAKPGTTLDFVIDSIPIPKSLTSYKLTVTARDYADNVNSDYLNFSLGSDNTGPYFPSEGGYGAYGVVSSGKITAYCKYYDSGCGASGVTISISKKNSESGWSAGKTVYGDNVNCEFTLDGEGKSFEQGATYYINFAMFDNLTNYSWTVRSVLFTTPKPSRWTWSDKARAAFTGGGPGSRYTTQVTVVEWNSFVDKVIEFSEWWVPGSSNAYVYGHKLSDCKMWIPGNNILKASYFNRVRYAVGSLSSTNIPDKSPGDQVLGSFFITLESCLAQLNKFYELVDNYEELNTFTRASEIVGREYEFGNSALEYNVRF